MIYVGQFIKSIWDNFFSIVIPLNYPITIGQICIGIFIITTLVNIVCKFIGGGKDD